MAVVAEVANAARAMAVVALAARVKAKAHPQVMQKAARPTVHAPVVPTPISGHAMRQARMAAHRVAPALNALNAKTAQTGLTVPKAVAPATATATAMHSPAPTLSATPACAPTTATRPTKTHAAALADSPTRCAPASTPWLAVATVATGVATATAAVVVVQAHPVAHGAARPTRCAPATAASGKLLTAEPPVG